MSFALLSVGISLFLGKQSSKSVGFKYVTGDHWIFFCFISNAGTFYCRQFYQNLFFLQYGKHVTGLGATQLMYMFIYDIL